MKVEEKYFKNYSIYNMKMKRKRMIKSKHNI